MVKKKIKNKLALLIIAPVLFIECNITGNTEHRYPVKDSSGVQVIKESPKPIRTGFHTSACGSGIANR